MQSVKHADADNGWCSQCKWWPFDHYCPTEHPLWATVQAMHAENNKLGDSVVQYNMGCAWLSAANMLQAALFKELNPDWEASHDRNGYPLCAKEVEAR